ncbi:MAG: hypothetical protein AMXMBFR84_49870 [Candidatus Hydrogenedentota bacterium]
MPAGITTKSDSQKATRLGDPFTGQIPLYIVNKASTYHGLTRLDEDGKPTCDDPWADIEDEEWPSN